MLLAAAIARAQSPHDPVGGASVNIPYLEHLVKIQVDSVRRAKGLPPLVNDSIAYVAAVDHAGYLSKEKDIGHFQQNQRKKTPQDRVDHYGARDYYAGENVLSYPLGATYMATARRMVSGWVHSPGHYKNIITKDYQVTGVAVRRHVENGNFIAVQVFAHVRWRYSFKSDRKLFPYDTTNVIAENPVRQLYGTRSGKEKLPWKIKPLHSGKARNTSGSNLFYLQTLHIRPGFDGDKIYMQSRMPDLLMKAMRKRRDGLAVEIVDYEPYHCGNPAYHTALSRRNGNSSVNGQVLKPIYKHALLQDLREQKQSFDLQKRQELQKIRANKPKFKLIRSEQARRKRRDFRKEKQTVRRKPWLPTSTTVPVGSWRQKDSGTYVTANFLLLHKKKIVAPLYYTDVCGNFNFTDSLQAKRMFAYPEMDFGPVRTELTFRIPFAAYGIQPDPLVMRAIADTLKNQRIDSLMLDVFASVEGNERLNRRLYGLREKQIRASLHDYISDSHKVQVRAGENWGLLRRQIQGSPFQHWQDWPEDSIRKEFGRPEVVEKWRQNLDAQRMAQLRILARQPVRDTLRYLMQHHKSPTPGNAALWQKYHHGHWQRGHAAKDSVYAAMYPRKQAYSALIANQLWFEYDSAHTSWDEQQWKSHWLAINDGLKIRGDIHEIRFYAVFFMLRHWELVRQNGYGFGRVLKLIDQLEEHGDYATEKMKTVFYLRALPFYQQTNDFKNTQEGVEHVFEFYRDNPEIKRDAGKTLDLANFFIQLDANEQALWLLDDYLMKTGFDAEIYIQFLKLAFVHPDYQHNADYTNLLVKSCEILSKSQWCDLFVGQCRINFQVFDDARLRDLYCAQCADIENEATKMKK